jgi:hypothetical protein
MQGSWRMIAMVLVGVTVAANPGAHALAFLTTAAAHPAGCHSHAPATPAPISYQCCVSGHHAAMPNASFSPRALTAPPCGLGDEQLCRSSEFDRRSVMFVDPSNRPPGAAPLRI